MHPLLIDLPKYMIINTIKNYNLNILIQEFGLKQVIILSIILSV